MNETGWSVNQKKLNSSQLASDFSFFFFSSLLLLLYFTFSLYTHSLETSSLIYQIRIKVAFFYFQFQNIKGNRPLPVFSNFTAINLNIRITILNKFERDISYLNSSLIAFVKMFLHEKFSHVVAKVLWEKFKYMLPSFFNRTNVFN